MTHIIGSSRDKVRAHRARLREQGLRPIQIWVPDVRARSFITAAHKQSLAVAAGKRAATDQAFIDAISEDSERNGLKHEYRLMIDKLTTVPKTRLGDRIGHLDGEDLVRLNRALIVFLGLAGTQKKR